jgi:hypothetical protein
MSLRRYQPPRLRLEDLVDLEMQFQADRERDSLELRRRDAEIGQAIDARRLAQEGRDREMFLAWLERIRGQADPHATTPGRQLKLFLEIVGLVLALLGFGLGFGAVTGWLRMNPTEPVNAIFFWAVIIGIQLVLLCVWLMAVLPTGWLRYLPGVEAFQMLLRLIARALPLAVTWAAAKLSPEHRLLLARLRGTLESWGWIYGKIRFWKLIGLTQLFAVAYNVGAMLAFVAVSYGNDPAFGWKSRLLSPEELHGVVRVLAAPWSSFWPAAAPTLEQIARTRFWSLDPRYLEPFQTRAAATDAWALWWPFLMACLLFYGLIPRLLTLAISRGNERRALNRVKLDHGDFYKLKDRLTRPLVETQAVKPEVTAETKTEVKPPQPSGSGHQGVEAPFNPPQPEHPPPPLAVPHPSTKPPLETPSPSTPPTRTVVQWAGVNLGRDDLARLVRERFGVEAAEVYTVGDLQGRGDAKTLRALENNGQGELLMVVESWEPPIADYVDFLTEMRGAVGRERMIVVLLYNRDAAGRPLPPRPRDVQIWRDQIATLGDPWMCVEELIEPHEELKT